MRQRTAILGLLGLAASGAGQSFGPEERQRVVSFWGEPGRYTVSAPPDAALKGPYQVRLSIAGSQWLWSYDRARGLSKGPPTQDAAAQSEEQKSWEAWLQKKIAFDRWTAGTIAGNSNAMLMRLPQQFSDPMPEVPGLIPQGLLQLAGNPPPFAQVVVPMQHAVRFDEKMTITYVDNPLMRPRYAYYRFAHGVMSAGSRVRELPTEFVQNLFAEAGVAEGERKVMAAVSLLEGGFDSVNTYDTGFVSVGFIQFACLKDGAGSLGQVLKRQKQDNPKSFDEDFRAFGLDVSEAGALVAMDVTTGAELIGAAAAQKIIDDPRLVAVFQRAGKLSKPFRLAQIRVAKGMYYPGDDVASIQVGGRTLSGKLSTIVKSEAGMATLMDRKVNTGTLEPLPTVLALVAGENGIQKFEDLALFERDIVTAMKFRKDYLADANLTQPGPAKKPKRDYGSLARHQVGRRGRGG